MIAHTLVEEPVIESIVDKQPDTGTNKNPLLGGEDTGEGKISMDGSAVPNQSGTAWILKTRHKFQPKCLNLVRRQRNFIGRAFELTTDEQG